MNIIHFTGNCGRAAELREVRGDKVCNFTVAVKQGFGRDAPVSWYRVEVWGKRGEALAQHIVKGAKVAVCGEFIIDEYEGKPQYRVRAHDVDPFCGGNRDDGAAHEPERKPNASSDLDDFIPF